MKPRIAAAFIGWLDRANGLPHRAQLLRIEDNKGVLTSRIVAIRPESGEIETLNTIYVVGES